MSLTARQVSRPRIQPACLAPGLDIKPPTGGIVVAPSIHPDTGKTYEWDSVSIIPMISRSLTPPTVARRPPEKAAERDQRLSKPGPILGRQAQR